MMPALSSRTRWIVAGPEPWKSQEYFLTNLRRLIRSVYEGNLGGEFIDIMASLVQGQINDAYEQAWIDEGTGGDYPDYLANAAEAAILGQFDFVDGLYRDTVDARVDGTPLEPLMSRAELWANQWESAYNNGLHLIQLEEGGKEVWHLGETEDHCATCAALDGMVAYASEWEQSGIHPQGAPNNLLECGGWRCDCRREPTDARRSPNALTRLLDIATAQSV